MNYNNNYAASCETRDWQKMKEFVEGADFFTSCWQEEQYATIDGHAVRKGNPTKNYNVELKYRDMNHDMYDTYFLECDKYAELRRWSDNGYTPLYINFFNDGYTAIWNVDPTKGGIDVGEPVKRRSKDNYTSMQEKTAKYELPIGKAVIYDSTYTRTQ